MCTKAVLIVVHIQTFKSPLLFPCSIARRFPVSEMRIEKNKIVVNKEKPEVVINSPVITFSMLPKHAGPFKNPLLIEFKRLKVSSLDVRNRIVQSYSTAWALPQLENHSPSIKYAILVCVPVLPVFEKHSGFETHMQFICFLSRMSLRHHKMSKGREIVYVIALWRQLFNQIILPILFAFLERTLVLNSLRCRRALSGWVDPRNASSILQLHSTTGLLKREWFVWCAWVIDLSKHLWF